MKKIKPETSQIDPQIYELYDEFAHSGMPRREFFARAAALTVVGGLSGLQMAKLLLPDYVKAQEVSFNDDRLKATYVTYNSPGGNSGKMRGYLVKPDGAGPFPSVLVVHENRGLNPYIEDVARRLAVEGFLALAPDALSVVGGYPGNDEEGKLMQAKLDREKIYTDMYNSALYLKNHELSNKKLGVTGFCFGGAVSNHLAVRMGGQLQAAVPFYGTAPDLEQVDQIKAKLLIHYAQNDPRVNETMKLYKEALEKNKVSFEMQIYEGTQHGFHNYSTPRYDEKAAKLAWSRTIALFKETLT